MPLCLCSNCHPGAAEALIAAQANISNDTFDLTATSLSNILLDKPLTNRNTMSSNAASRVVKMQDCKSNDLIRSQPRMIQLADTIRINFEALYNLHFGDVDYFLTPTELLSEEKVWKIVKNHEFFLKGGLLRHVLGSTAIKGDFDCITDTVTKWFQNHQRAAFLPHVTNSGPTQGVPICNVIMISPPAGPHPLCQRKITTGPIGQFGHNSNRLKLQI